VAARLGITRQRVHALAQQGTLTAVREGRTLFYTEESVQARERDRAAAAARASQPQPPPKPRGPRPATPPPGTLRAADVAVRLGITRQRVHALGQQGTLTAVREGRALFYTEESVQARERDRAQD
jgi:DNA-binding transcriptional MerR regulator